MGMLYMGLKETGGSVISTKLDKRNLFHFLHALQMEKKWDKYKVKFST